MKKFLKNLLLFISFLLTGCNNFMDGSSLKKELNEQINYAANKNPLSITQASPVFQQGGVSKNTPIKIVFNHAIDTSTFKYSIKDNNGNDLKSNYKSPVFNQDKTTVYIYYDENSGSNSIEGNTTLTVSVDKDLRDVYNKKFSFEDYVWSFSVNDSIDNTPPVIEFCNFTDVKTAEDESFKTSSFKNYDLLTDDNENKLNENNILSFAYAKEIKIYIEGYSNVSSIDNVLIKETLVNYSDGSAVKNPKVNEERFTPDDTNCKYMLTKESKDAFLITYELDSRMDGAVRFDVFFTGANGVLSEAKSFKVIKFSTLNLNDITVTNEPNQTYYSWDFDYDDDDDHSRKSSHFKNFTNDLRNLRWTIKTTSIYKDIAPSVTNFKSTLKYGPDLTSLESVDVYESNEKDGWMHATLPPSKDYIHIDTVLGRFTDNTGLPLDGAVAILTITLESLNLETTKTIYFPASPVKVHAFQETIENSDKYNHYVYFENYQTPDNKKLSLIYYTRKDDYHAFDHLHITGELNNQAVFFNENTDNKDKNPEKGLIDTNNDGVKDDYDSTNCIYAGWDSRQCASYKTEDGIYGPVCDFFEVEPYWSSGNTKSLETFEVTKLSYTPNRKSTRASNLIDVNIEVNKSIKEIARTKGYLGTEYGYKHYKYSILKVYLTPEKDKYDNTKLAACTIIGNVQIPEGDNNLDMKTAVVTIDSTQWWNQYMIVETVIAGHFTPFQLCNTKVFEPLSKGGREIENDSPVSEYPDGSICTLNNAKIERDVNTGKIKINTQLLVKETDLTDLQQFQQMFTTQKNISINENNFDLLSSSNNTLQTVQFSEFNKSDDNGFNEYIYNYTAEYNELEYEDYTLSGQLTGISNEKISFYSLSDIINKKDYEIESNKVILNEKFESDKTKSVIIHSFKNGSWNNEEIVGFSSNEQDISSNIAADSFISVQVSVQQEKYNQLSPRKIFYNGTECSRSDFYKFFEEGSKQSYWIVSDKPALIRVLQSNFDRGEEIKDWEADSSVVKECLTKNDNTFTSDAFIFDTDEISSGKYYTVLAYFADNSVKIINQGYKK